MKKNLEYRHVVGLRANPDSRKIGGLAIAVESKSELMGGQFYETIKRNAVDDALIKSNDIKLYINHDSTQGTIARSKFGKGSLRLFITDRGLEFETDVPNTAKGDEVLEGIRRGDIDACSFAFMADSVTWTENEDGTYSRDINSFKMIDECSILSCLPAYPATSVDMRSLDDFKDFEKDKEEKKKATDDNMPEPITKDYRSAEEEQEKEKVEEKSAEDEKVEEQEEEKKRSDEEEKPSDEKTDEEEKNRSEDDEKEKENEPEEKSEEDEQEKEEKSSDEDEDEDEEEDRKLASYYKSLRSLLG